MREKRFVDQNKKNWARFEEITDSKNKVNPEEISDLFSQITNDLSFSRTHYPKRSIRVYLNSLARKIYLQLYRQRGNQFKNFRRFWTRDLPLALYQARKELNVSLLFFLGSMAIGIISSVHDPEFAQVILGGEYIAMTEENIEKGDPMGVYKTAKEFDMFFRITLNNLLVAFRTFVLGAFFGVGTLVIMLYNGIMVGTFQYFFIERDLLQESFLTIWMHGALEISSIVIAGAAGLTMGRGLLFPGTLPRRQSFILGARRAMKIMIGLVPIFITAGFIEGYFTRLTEMPDFLRGSFIFMCFAFVGAYFWWFPILRYKGRKDTQEELAPDMLLVPVLRELRNTKEIFSSTFIFFRLTIAKIAGLAFLSSILFTVAFYFIERQEGLEEVGFTKFSLFNLYRFHDYDTFPALFFLNWIFVAVVILFSLKFIRKVSGDGSPKIEKGLIVKALVITALFEMVFLADFFLVSLIGLAAIPFLLFWLIASAYEAQNLPNSFGSMLSLLNGTRRNIFATFFYIALISVIVLFLVDSPFTWFYLEVVQWNIDAPDSVKANLAVLSLIFVNYFGLALLLPLSVYAQVLEYHAAVEAKNAGKLSRRVGAIGVSRKAYGLEKE